eukprot:TRINITY_DN7386_c0_g1_i1.p1 TRINITY_DN7386_c0_g1~~TRINITY_DN7386_c0_g1_i1.p1  ORF type:complete len:424 (-),score=99.02 TRINITY_DN7386_c0_g1_i1:10-1281(-)
MTDSWTYPKDLLKKIPPQHYMHILNNNTNVVRVEVGPKTLLCSCEEVAVLGPEPMVVIPPRHYAIVEDPVIKTVDEYGQEVIVTDYVGQPKLRHGATEIRLEQPPFPLYPGERLKGRVTQLQFVGYNAALQLECTDDVYVENGDGEKELKIAGSTWMFYGPDTYIPQENVKIVHTVTATIIKPSQALKLKALVNFVDRTGTARVAGEQWLYTKEGAFIPDVEEEIVNVETAHILTDKRALHVEALYNFMDGEIERFSGDRWLVTKEDCDEYIPHVNAKVVNQNVTINTLTKRQWCVITHPYNEETKKNEYGRKKMIRGESTFFLHPNEEMGPISQVYVLGAESALKVRALENFRDGSGVSRVAGQQWLEYGPKEYWPPVEVEIQSNVQAFLAVEGLGLYLFNPEIIVLFLLSIFSAFILYLIL